MQEFLGELDSDQCSPERANTFDIEYHRFLGKLSHNQIVERIYNFVIELFTPTINPIHEGVREAHRALHEALLDRDTERAVKCVRTHTEIWVASHFEGND